MNVLSLQSHVAYGHVGNSAACFPIQRLGHEVWPVHTVQFSNHPGYGSWQGQVFEGSMISDIVAGIAARGVLATCDAVLSGYMGSEATGAAVLDAVARVRAANPGAVYACDPVIGDTGRGIYVRPGIPEFMRDHAVPAADFITPNQFELEFLAGQPVHTHAGLEAALAILHARGPRIILVTSLHGVDTPEDALDMIVSTGEAIHRLRTPKLACEVNGAGDAVAALFLVHYLETRDAAFALARAGATIRGLLEKTVIAGAREMLLVAAQEEIVSPSYHLVTEKL